MILNTTTVTSTNTNRLWQSAYAQAGIAPDLPALAYQSLGQLAHEICQRYASQKAFACVVPNGMNGSLTCVYFLVIGLGVFGMASGCAVQRLLKQGKNGARTITLEIGIQNGPLAVLIVRSSLVGTLQQEVLLVPVLYSLTIVLTSLTVTVWFGHTTDAENRTRERRKEGVMQAN